MTENKSNIYTQTGPNSQQIGIQNNYHSQNLEINLKYNSEGKLTNIKEISVNLLSISNYNFNFIIINTSILSDIFYENICLELKKNVLVKLKSNSWDEKTINEFIANIYNIDNFRWIEEAEDYSKEKIFNDLLFDFLLNIKIKRNEMPNLYDKNLANIFYNENINYDFIKVFGYEFKKIYNIIELIELFELKYTNSLFKSYLYLIKNHNVLVLENFFDSNTPTDRTYINLKTWLSDNKIKSNLLDSHYLKNLGDIFNLALGDGFFNDENLTLWNELQNRWCFEDEE